MSVESIPIQWICQRALIALPDDFEAADGEPIRAALDQAVAAAPTVLVVDMSGLASCSPRGVRLLMKAGRAAARMGTPLRVAGLRPAVREVFEAAGAAKSLDIFPDTQAALAGHDGTPGGAAGVRGERAGVSRYQLAAVLGVPESSVDRALDQGLLPARDGDGRWPEATVAELRGRWPQIAAALEQAQELGAARSAELLARATGLPVTAADVTEMQAQGVLRATRLYRNHPMYRVADVQDLAGSAQAREQVAAIVAQRRSRRAGRRWSARQG